MAALFYRYKEKEKTDKWKRRKKNTQDNLLQNGHVCDTRAPLPLIRRRPMARRAALTQTTKKLFHEYNFILANVF
jgi:hypothetical protein